MEHSLTLLLEIMNVPAPYRLITNMLAGCADFQITGKCRVLANEKSESE